MSRAKRQEGFPQILHFDKVDLSLCQPGAVLDQKQALQFTPRQSQMKTYSEYMQYTSDKSPVNKRNTV